MVSKPNPEKIRAMREMPSPEDTKGAWRLWYGNLPKSLPPEIGRRYRAYKQAHA